MGESREEKELKERLAACTRQLEDTRERLLHQDKMASLGKLASSVVHEINNPVSGILNMLMLSQRIIREENVESREMGLFLHYLNLMETETRRISGIVNNLLMFARQSKLELVPCDINSLIDQTLVLNSNLLKINHVNVERLFENDLPLVRGSEDQLKQVFMNIISNAAASMADQGGGRLIVSTFSKPDENTVFIRFKDTGPGIDKGIMTHIFEPFYTTRKKGKGVGLGLSVVSTIVEDHNGTIEVKSDPPDGAEFTISLFSC